MKRCARPRHPGGAIRLRLRSGDGPYRRAQDPGSLGQRPPAATARSAAGCSSASKTAARSAFAAIRIIRSTAASSARRDSPSTTRWMRRPARSIPLLRRPASPASRPRVGARGLGRGARRRWPPGFAACRNSMAPDAVGVISTGQLVTEEFYTLGKLVQLGFGTHNYDGNTTLCMASAVAGYKRSFGSDGPPGAYEDLEKADVILLIGANIADNHPDPVPASGGEPEQDPDRRRSARHEDGDAGRPAPAAEAALGPRAAQRLIHILIEHDLIDRDYIDRAHHRLRRAARVACAEYTPEHVCRRSPGCPPTCSTRPRSSTAAPAPPSSAGRWASTTAPRAPRPSTRSTTWRCSPATSAAPARRRSRSPASAMRWARAKPASPRACPATASSRARAIAKSWRRSGTCRSSALPTARGLAYPDIIEGAARRTRSGALDHRHQPARVVSESRRAAAGARDARFPGRAGRLSSDADHRARPPRAAGRDLGREGRHLHQLRAPRQQGQ